MCGGPGVREATALVDGDVHEHRARLHLSDKRIRYELRCLGARNEHRADHQVGPLDGPLQVHGGRVAGADRAAEFGIQFAQLVEVHIENRDMSTHSGGDPRGVVSGDTTTDDDHVGGADARNAPHHHAAAAHRGHQMVGPDLRGEPPRHLTHRGQQGECTVGGLHGLVSDRCGFRLQQRLGAGQGCGQVQVGEESLSPTHQGVLGLDRFLDLEEQIGFGPDLFGTVDNLRARGFEVHIGYRRAFTRAGLDDHLVATAGQLGHTGRGSSYAELVVLDFGRDAYTHDALLFRN